MVLILCVSINPCSRKECKKRLDGSQEHHALRHGEAGHARDVKAHAPVHHAWADEDDAATRCAVALGILNHGTPRTLDVGHGGRDAHDRARGRP